MEHNHSGKQETRGGDTASSDERALILEQAAFNIAGVDCVDCALTVERNIASMRGVSSARIGAADGRLEVQYDPAQVGEKEVEKRIYSLGYRVRVSETPFSDVGGRPEVEIDPERHAHSFREESASGLRRLLTARWQWMFTGASGVFTIAGAAGTWAGLNTSIVVGLYVAAIALGGWNIARKGFHALRTFSLDMNFLMTVAVMGAAAIGEWLEGATVIFLFSVAELLESAATGKARRAIRSLMKLSPLTAAIRTDAAGGAEAEDRRVPVESVQVGTLIVVKPGDKIPLDGVVREGSSSVDQAPITGESMPVAKAPGDIVFAGTINLDGALEVEVTAEASDTTLARIIHMVEAAQAKRAPVQQTVDRFARIYTPSVVAAAVLMMTAPTLIWGEAFGTWFYRALVLLVVACPCALVISTPVTIVSALARAAREGILIKGGAYLERAGHIDKMIFDKTGTLTEGVPRVVDTIALNGMVKEDVLRVAAAVESQSEHPLAQAVIEKARGYRFQMSEAASFRSHAGKGAQASVDGRTYYMGSHRFFDESGLCTPDIAERIDEVEHGGQTAVLLWTDSEPLALLAVADSLRTGGVKVIEELRSLGIRDIEMLTGDNRITAEGVAAQLGIDTVHAELLPEQKVGIVEESLEDHKTVAMVGDGVNDAPALAAASVGIAMGTAGTDQALETADIALMGDDLSKLPVLLRLARSALTTIKQNVAFSIVVKGAVLALTPFGIATLWMAVAADMGASLIVILSGMRMLRLPLHNR